jgi:hypothetical protein
MTGTIRAEIRAARAGLSRCPPLYRCGVAFGPVRSGASASTWSAAVGYGDHHLDFGMFPGGTPEEVAREAFSYFEELLGCHGHVARHYLPHRTCNSTVARDGPATDAWAPDGITNAEVDGRGDEARCARILYDSPAP